MNSCISVLMNKNCFISHFEQNEVGIAQSRSLRNRSVYFNIITFFVCSVFFYSCGNDNPTTTELPTEQSLYLNHHDSAKYVGMNTCKQCHGNKHETFIHTGMGMSFDVASKQKTSAKFGKNAFVYDNFLKMHCNALWKKDSFYINEFRLSGKDTLHNRIEKVDYIIGSGQHTNSHIYSTNGYLHQMPMTYYTQDGRWDLPPGFENGANTRFSRPIGLECMSCHNALPDFVMGSENKYTNIPNGISCERCHGPGSIHVALKQQGVMVDTAKYIDYSIVNPAKLPMDLQFDVCQRCHLQGNTILKDGKSFFDFKPGMRLSDVMTVFLPKYEGAEDEFIMASHADRLKQSKCFIKSFNTNSTSLKPSKDALTCITCHNPHISVKETNLIKFNNACINCHTESKHNFCTETKQNRLTKKDNCVSCHMPKSGAIDIPHVRVTDHYIRKPIKNSEVEKIKTFIGLYAINEKNPAAIIKARAYINQFEKFDTEIPGLLDSAMKYIALSKQDSLPELIQVYFLNQQLDKICVVVNKVGKEKVTAKYNRKNYANTDAWTLYRIGEAFYTANQMNDAIYFYKQASALAPFIMDFKNKLATSLAFVNKIEEAKNIYESIITEMPNHVQAHCNLGYLYLLIGNDFMAELHYKKALALDPNYEQVVINLYGYYSYKNNKSKADLILANYLKFNKPSDKIKAILTSK